MTNLLLGCDTTNGLLGSMAALLQMDLPPEMPPLIGGEREGDRIIADMLEPLWHLGPDKAMCCVTWTAGRMMVRASERFTSVFMGNTDVEEGIIAFAQAPHQLWAGYVFRSA